MSMKGSPKQARSTNKGGAEGRMNMNRSHPIRNNQRSSTGSFGKDRFTMAGYPSGSPIKGVGQKG